MEMNENIKKELTDDEISKVSGGTGDSNCNGIIPLCKNGYGDARWYDEVNKVTFEYKCPDCGGTMFESYCWSPMLECECGIGPTDPSKAKKIIIGPGKLME